MTIIVADDGSTLDYIRSMAFPDGAEDKKRGLISAFHAPRLANTKTDLVVIGANYLLLDLYERCAFQLVPKWIQLILPVLADPTAMFNRSDLDPSTRKYFRRLCRTLENGRYSYEVTTDPEWFDWFYHQMYLPYIMHRHGDMAIIHSYRELKRTYTRGMGIIVNKDGKQAAAGIVDTDGNTMALRQMGVLNGDISIAREGAASALDFYAVDLAHSLGFTKVNFGHARAFLSDGGLRHKLIWNTEPVEDNDAISVFAIAAPGETEPARNFLAAHPFFELTRHGIERSTRDK